MAANSEWRQTVSLVVLNYMERRDYMLEFPGIVDQELRIPRDSLVGMLTMAPAAVELDRKNALAAGRAVEDIDIPAGDFAAQLGLEFADRIVEFNGRTIRSYASLIEALETARNQTESRELESAAMLVARDRSYLFIKLRIVPE